MNRPEQMWATLLQAGVVRGTAPETAKPESPWYVRVLLAFSGWVAALFLLGFIGVGFQFVFRHNGAAFIIGGMMIGGAFALLRIPNNEFVEHLALATSLAGQALVVYAIFDISDHNEKITWVLIALLQISLAAVMTNFVHRIFSSFFASLAFSMALAIMGCSFAVCGIVMLLAAMCWLNEFRYPHHMTKLQAMGYGLVLSLILLKGTALFGYRMLGWRIAQDQAKLWGNPWMGEGFIGVVALYVVWHLLQQYDQNISKRISITVLLGTLLLCTVSIKVQGVTVGMVIMLLGFSGTNRILLGLGIASLLFYISSYYYMLDTTLLSKSQSLLVVGLVLLGVRWIMLHTLPGKMEAQHD